MGTPAIDPVTGPGSGPGRGIERRLLALFALACGASVANLYYAQPLLDLIATDLGVSPGAAGLLVTASQIGYAIGLVTLVPLGDRLPRHRLIAPMVAACALALLGAAAARGLAVLASVILLVGVTSVVAQVIIPLAGSLAADHQRGTVVGTVMSGLLIGILVARTASGLLAAAAGWRAVYLAGAALTAVLVVVLHRAVPRLPPADPDLSYRTLFRSLVTLTRQEPVLRRRMAYGGLGFAGFSIVWTALAFLIASPAYGYSEAVTGLLGLAGLAGVGAAQAAGRLADRGRAHPAMGVFLGTVLASWSLLWVGGGSLVVLIVGLLVLELGMQGQHITNMSVIYALRPEARGRMATLYMSANFLLGAAASTGAAVAWSLGGWDAVTALGALVAAVGVAVWVDEHRRLKSARSSAAATDAADPR